MARVIGAHDALELRELAHHVGQEVGLGQARAALGQRHVEAEALGDAGGQLRHAFAALGLGAQLVVVDHVGQLRQARFQGLLLVLLEEELRIRQARAHDALVAADDGGRVVGRQVRHDQEARTQLARAVRQREILLVGLHGQDQAFLRHRQEFVLEAAFVDHRPFDQRGHFVQQRFRHQDLVAARFFQQLLADAFLARFGGREHLAFAFQHLRVLVGVRHGNLAAMRQEAVAHGVAAGFQPQQVQRQHLFAVQGEQQVDRAHELHGGAVRALVAHDLRDRQLGHGLLQDVLQGAGQRAAGCGVGIEEGFGLAVLGAFEVRDLQIREAEGGQLLGQRRGRVAVLVQRDRNRQHLLADRFIRRGVAHVGDGDGQAARSGVGGGDAVAFQEVARLQAVGDAVRERGAELDERFRRQFFGLDFDEESLVHDLFCSCQAAALSEASVDAGSIGKPSFSRES